MEKATPKPEPLPLEKFDDSSFGDFDMNQSIETQSDNMDESMKDSYNTLSRRSKAE
jgi:hypothetical protein